MSAQAPLPDAELIRLEYLVSTDHTITLVATAVQPEVRCPDCDRPATHPHSSNRRTAADLPWHDLKVRLEFRLRRFFCDYPGRRASPSSSASPPWCRLMPGALRG